jgi:hypothetical protein
MGAAGIYPSRHPEVTLGSTAANLPLTPARSTSSQPWKPTVSEAGVKTYVDFVSAHGLGVPLVIGDCTTVVLPAPPIDLIELYKMMPLVPSTMPLLAVANITFR